VAIDGGIRSKSFRGFYSIWNGGWLSAFELRIRYQLSGSSRMDIVLTALLMGRSNMGIALSVSITVDGGILGLERDRKGDGRVGSAAKGVL